MEEDEDADLAKALALSKGDDVDMEDAAGNDEGNHDEEDDEGLTEEEAIARAIALSMKEQAEGDQNK
jgi:26S proteasome regulatory subunit N10